MPSKPFLLPMLATALLALGGCAAKVGQPGPVLFDAQLIGKSLDFKPHDDLPPNTVSLGGLDRHQVAVTNVLLGELSMGRLTLWLPLGHAWADDYRVPTMRILGRIEPSGDVVVHTWAFRHDILCVSNLKAVVNAFSRDTATALDKSGKAGCPKAPEE
jgi:hypothetical protein